MKARIDGLDIEQNVAKLRTGVSHKLRVTLELDLSNPVVQQLLNEERQAGRLEARDAYVAALRAEGKEIDRARARRALVRVEGRLEKAFSLPRSGAVANNRRLPGQPREE